MRRFYSRKHPRWPDHDYARAAYYFITAVTHNRNPILGSIGADGFAPTGPGEIVMRLLTSVNSRFPSASTDTFVVMPDHFHAIIDLTDDGCASTNVCAVVQWIKGKATHEIRRQCDDRIIGPIWQTSFHDHVIRSDKALDALRRYVVENPTRAWLRTCAAQNARP
jgi:REP element-mobilizing transposase RayT